MGLDMNLYKKKYFYHNIDGKDTTHIEVKVLKNGKEQEHYTFTNHPVGIEVEIAYWRKFNALHKWFMDVCGEGDEEYRDHNKRLLERVKSAHEFQKIFEWLYDFGYVLERVEV